MKLSIHFSKQCDISRHLNASVTGFYSVELRGGNKLHQLHRQSETIVVYNVDSEDLGNYLNTTASESRTNSSNKTCERCVLGK